MTAFGVFTLGVGITAVGTGSAFVDVLAVDPITDKTRCTRAGRAAFDVGAKGFWVAAGGSESALVDVGAVATIALIACTADAFEGAHRVRADRPRVTIVAVISAFVLIDAPIGGVQIAFGTLASATDADFARFTTARDALRKAGIWGRDLGTLNQLSVMQSTSTEHQATEMTGSSICIVYADIPYSPNSN